MLFLFSADWKIKGEFLIWRAILNGDAIFVSIKDKVPLK